MDLKQLLFGGGAKASAAEPFRDSIQAWLPIKNIVGGVVVTKDGRFVKILEVLPVNIYLKSPNDRENIISSYAAQLEQPHHPARVGEVGGDVVGLIHADPPPFPADGPGGAYLE